jgi:hypothetical protein
MGTQGSPVKSYDYLLKFLLVGDSDVGKGEILESLQDGAAESPYAYSNGRPGRRRGRRGGSGLDGGCRGLGARALRRPPSLPWQRRTGLSASGPGAGRRRPAGREVPQDQGWDGANTARMAESSPPSLPSPPRRRFGWGCGSYSCAGRKCLYCDVVLFNFRVHGKNTYGRLHHRPGPCLSLPPDLGV